MNKILLSALAAILLPFAAMAQSKQSPSLDDLMWGGTNYWNLVPRSTPTAWWGDALVHVDVDRVTLLRDARGRAAGNAPLLFDLDAVNAALDTATYGAVRTLASAQFPDGGKPLVRLANARTTLIYDWTLRRVVWQGERPKGVSHEDFHDGSRALAYVRGFDLYVRTADGRTHRVSNDGSRQLLYGTSVHRNEFGIEKGTYWSPDGSRLAFYRMDQSMVTDFPLVSIAVSDSQRVAQPAPEAYPMAGMTIHKVRVGVFDPATDHTVWLDAGDPTDRYFTNIAWSPDGSRIYMFELPRSQDRADLVEYDAATGRRLRVLYTERDARYVEPMHPIAFLPWDATKFVVQSRRDGYNHLYLFDRDGHLLRQLTRGEYEVLDVLGFNPKARSIVYRSNEHGQINENLYAVHVGTARRILLDNGLGVHRATLSGQGTFLRDTWSKPDTYRVSEIRTTAKAAALVTLDQFASPWENYEMPFVQGGMLTAADGKTPLHYRLVMPVNFDPKRKYPTIVYVYGGPHATNVKASWNFQARPWEYYMANKGYVLFVLDNRGSADRGMDFESVTRRCLGEVEMADQMCGVDFLRSLPFVDADRIGVHGWSFGGFMTTNLMLTHNDVFKVGVAGGPVIDWKYYEAMYGERYMDTPQENPEGYAASSLLNKAGRLKGRLQIIVGYNDPVCLLQHSLAFLRACEDAGTQPDYFVYPNQEHNMTGRDMVHLHERITRYFEDHLK